LGKIRVIVAEAPAGSAQPSGLLRTVLEQEGVEVAGEVETSFELVQLAADEQPDAVVFADVVPQEELAQLRRVAPGAKIVLVSPILTAAEAELASAVVERTDVLRSLGPVLVLLCTPGHASARRGTTESFDRPDWIDRVRKDPVTLREILGAGPREAMTERPNITSLQGEVRASGAAARAADDDVVTIPDVEDEPAIGALVHLPEAGGSDVEVGGAVPSAPRRARRWALGGAVASLLIVGLAVNAARLPAPVIRGDDEVRLPTAVAPTAGIDEDTHDGVADSPRRGTGGDAADPADGDVIAPQGDDGGTSPGNDSGGGDPGAAPGPGTAPAPPPGDDPVSPGSAADHNPHGVPPGQTDVHPGGKDHAKP
jgi:hypothetical protein